ncbi:MAG: alkaline ceramidase [Planctomycetaceae bacterium]|nr:alkaline ceramidase [Planctomycetaceae bacterium]
MTQAPPARKHSGFRGLFGLSRADITPPVGIYSRNWGAAAHDVADSIHRPLGVNALTIQQTGGSKPLVLIDADLGWWRSLRLFRSIRNRILTELELEPSRFILAVTHSHATAPLMEADAGLPGNELIAPWIEHITQSIIACVQEALSTSFEGVLEWHTGRCQLAAERDLADRDGDRYVCGYNPSGTSDDTLLAGRLTDASGGLRAVVTHYACHPTTLAWDNTAISPDYIGAMRATVEQTTSAQSLFLLGACGELSPRNQYTGDHDIPDRHGRQLGHATLATLYDMEPPGTEFVFDRVVESGAPLAVWSNRPCELSTNLQALDLHAELKLKDWPSAEELERQRQECSDRALQERLRRKRDIRRTIGDGATFHLEVSAWRIGDAVLVGSCCEAYAFLQQELRRRFPDRAVICMNLINGSIGYLPRRELYDHNIYQVWQTPFERGGLEQLTDIMADAITQLLQKENSSCL